MHDWLVREEGCRYVASRSTEQFISSEPASQVFSTQSDFSSNNSWLDNLFCQTSEYILECVVGLFSVCLRDEFSLS